MHCYEIVRKAGTKNIVKIHGINIINLDGEPAISDSEFLGASILYDIPTQII